MTRTSDAKRLYYILRDEFDLSYWEIRTILLDKLGFSRSDPVLQQTLKQARRRLREENEILISRWVSTVRDMDPRSQVTWILHQVWPNEEAPIYEFGVVKDAIRRLNIISRDGTSIRWDGVRRLRRREVREAYRKWEEQTIAAWLILGAHVSVTETNYSQSGDADIS